MLQDMTLIVSKDFSQLANDEQIARTARSLEANGIHTLIVETGEDAKRMFFKLIPEGAQVHQASSATLDTLGITDGIEKSGRFDAVRPKVRNMDRATQGDQIRRLGASPDYMAGSVQAVTEDGHVLVMSASGSQLGPYVSGAGKVIWIVGAQKLVEDLNEGFQRVDEHVFPLENFDHQQGTPGSNHDDHCQRKSRFLIQNTRRLKNERNNHWCR
jgi:hypothetical protein